MHNLLLLVHVTRTLLPFFTRHNVYKYW